VLLLQLVQKLGVKHPTQPAFACVLIGVQAVPVTAKLIVFKKHFPYLRTNPLAHSLHYPELSDFKQILSTIYCLIAC
jgi:hypothetical protein